MGMTGRDHANRDYTTVCDWLEEHFLEHSPMVYISVG